MKGFYKRSKYAFVKRKITEPKILCNNQCLDSRMVYPNLPLFLQCAFIDPGTSSCGLRIVRYYLESELVEIIWCSILDFGNNTNMINIGMEATFSKIKLYLEDCHHIIVEHQIMKCELTYRCFSSIIYFVTTSICPNRMRPILFEVDVQLKTVFLGGPKTKKQNISQEMKEWTAMRNYEKTGIYTLPENGSLDIKEWTKMKSRQISIERHDYITYHILENSLYKGNEDLSDTVCYEYAWLPFISQKQNIYIPYRTNLL